MANPWLKTREFVCPDCKATLLRDLMYRHRSFECPSRTSDRHSSNMRTDRTTTLCRPWPDLTWMMNPCTEGKGVPDEVFCRMRPQ